MGDSIPGLAADKADGVIVWCINLDFLLVITVDKRYKYANSCQKNTAKAYFLATKCKIKHTQLNIQNKFFFGQKS